MASYELHQLAFRHAVNANTKLDVAQLLKELIEIRKLDKSEAVSNLIKLVLNLSSNEKWLNAQERMRQLSTKVNGRVWVSWIEATPLPLPAPDFKNVQPCKDMVRQKKLPDCSLIAVINAALFGRNHLEVNIVCKESANRFCCVFNVNGSRKVVVVPNTLDDTFMCSEYYGRVIEKTYFSMLGYYSGEDIQTESRGIKIEFKGSDFTDVAMHLLGFMPMARPMVLDIDEWHPIYQQWIRGDSIVGFGTSNFDNVKRIVLANGNPYILIPNHDYPVISIQRLENGYHFDVFDGVQLVEFAISDLIHFNILAVSLKPPSIHETETFISSGTCSIEYTLETDADTPFFVMLERHLPRSRDLAQPSQENLQLYQTTADSSGLLWEKTNQLECAWNISRFTLIQSNARHSQLCVDLKTASNQMYTLHFYSTAKVRHQRVRMDDYVVRRGCFNNQSRHNLLSNPSWNFTIEPTNDNQYADVNIGVLLEGATDDEVCINVLEDTTLLYDQSYQKSKQYKLLLLQTNRTYTLVLTTLRPSFAKFKVVSDTRLLFTE